MKEDQFFQPRDQPPPHPPPPGALPSPAGWQPGPPRNVADPALAAMKSRASLLPSAPSLVSRGSEAFWIPLHSPGVPPFPSPWLGVILRLAHSALTHFLLHPVPLAPDATFLSILMSACRRTSQIEASLLPPDCRCPRLKDPDYFSHWLRAGPGTVSAQ